ncbi:MAG: UDP-N-acetylmuramoyl-tripeptide--D-alanyl-D-alanine ligase, partial [Actinomycetota bacterium]|nr:UDP-N-acetylmuramoyl-tripeptide--D-alanyl-D-alanine ligase [Actinomycetota bacterium]
MIALTLAEIAAAVGGTLRIGDTDATSTTIVDGAVTTDSREIGPGDVFFAKRGEFDDGHRFGAAAAGQGAALLVVEHALDVTVPQIVVGDTVDALGALATEVVRRVRSLGVLRIVGVTGSNGKTTTKNLLRAVLERVGPTVAARASFNNEVGAPITMLELDDDTRFLVAEMGASAVGEIARLVRMARPDVGIVLKVGLAHAGEFGGIEQTVRAKSEMVTDLHATDVAVLNADDPRVVPMAGLTPARVVWFGLGPSADVRATDLATHARGTDFTVTVPGGESARVRFGVLGEHHVMNALAAIAASVELGVALPLVVEALETVTLAERWRMQLMGGRDGITVIN